MQPRCTLVILVILDHSLIFGVIIPEVVFIQMSSWGWAHSCSKHVEDSNKYIIKEIMREVYRLVGWAYMQVHLEFHVKQELHLRWPDETAALFTVPSFSTSARTLLSVKNATGMALFEWQGNSSWQKSENLAVLLRSVAFSYSVSFILLLQDTENQALSLSLSLDLKAFRAGLAGLGIVLHATHHIDCSCCSRIVGWMWVPSWRQHGSRCWANAAVAALSVRLRSVPLCKCCLYSVLKTFNKCRQARESLHSSPTPQV